ncbi:transcriptional regulator [Oceanicola sp. 22II-s10i]|uniref:TetR/AcrR family transcriptional regulator n=1 Tax=Oceanicola sp. 22II-s10i TaxID=1317116 RepID=UPI000B656850|nr:TetR/AcrR family transcriptional regulator [Oceanicola sp. 22II-s10i]OWU84517.1 transcriptional regulator [Oceanicola sp. 22II-s10i]
MKVEMEPLEDAADEPAYSPRVIEILEAGARVFAEKGYDAATMRDVSIASGVSKALLYHHFESKEQFFSQIASRSAKRLNDYVFERIPEDGTASEKVRAFMIATADFFQTYRWAWVASTTAFWNDPERHLQTERMERRAQFEHKLRDLIREGVESGEFNDLDPAITGRLILSSINWMHRWFNPERELTAAQIVEEYYGILLKGLAKR